MKLRLPATTTFLLTVERNRDRHEPRKRFFAERGFSDARWVFGRPTPNHHRGAREMAIETLESIRCPALWLEDDAAATHRYRDEIEVPNGAQMAYLGGTRNGLSNRIQDVLARRGNWQLLHRIRPSLLNEDMRLPQAMRQRALYTEINDPLWVRVITMFSGHAILWLDDDLRVTMLNFLKRSRESYDVAFARHQWPYAVYCLREPWFYQNDGHHDAKTLEYF